MKSDFGMKMLTTAITIAIAFALGLSFAQSDPFLDKLAAQSSAIAGCYKSSVVRYATMTCEPISVVVEAALGACSLQESAYKIAMVKLGGTPNYLDTAERIIAQAKVDVRQFLLSVAAETRINATTCAKNLN